MKLNVDTGKRGRTATLFGYIKPYPGSVALFLFLNLLGACFEGLGVGLIAPLLSGLDQSGALSTGNRVLDLLARPYASLREDARLPAVLGTILLLMVIKNVVGYARLLLNERLRIQMDQDLRMQLFDQLLNVEYRFILGQKSGDLLNHFGDSVPRTGMACRALLAQIPVLLAMGVYVGLLMVISWKMTLVALGLLGTLSIGLGGLMSKAQTVGAGLTLRNAAKLSINVEALSGMRLIRLSGGEDRERSRYNTALCDANGLEYQLARLVCLVRPLTEVAAIAVVAVLLLTGGTLLMSGESHLLPLLLTFMFVLYRLMPLATEFNRNRAEIAKHQGAVDATVDILDRDGKPYLSSGTKKTQPLKDGITFDAVRFSYGRENDAALDGVSLFLPAGKTTALVGASGGGKSTLADLIPRFYDPDSGRLLADGVDLREMDLRFWRSRIGFVSQDPFLFHATMRENVAYAKPQAKSSDVLLAAERAGVLEFVERLPQGLDTVIGDRGVRLSGGQRQRVAIARAILRDPEIMIMDEATSALDTISERMVQTALEELSKDRTTLIVAHRLSTVISADRVAVLEKGRLIEEGTHATLLGLDGAYRRYHDLQHLDRKQGESTLSLQTEGVA